MYSSISLAGYDHLIVTFLIHISSPLPSSPFCELCCYLVAQSCPAIATPWTVAHQAPLISQARILEWVPMPSSREVCQSLQLPENISKLCIICLGSCLFLLRPHAQG